MAQGMVVRELNAWYGDLHVVKNVSLNIPPQEITAIIGPSGCGKSTFLRCLNRMHQEIPGTRATGEARFQKMNVLDPGTDPVEIRRSIGMVFQRPNPFPTMSIFENVAAGLKLNGVGTKQQIAEIVERSLQMAALWDEVKDRLHHPATGLSGGQQQRLCIARALAVAPDILLMDEPSAALDPIATAKLEDLVTDLKSRYTIAIVTHNMQQAARISDSTAFFLKGELIEHGPTAKIFTTPGDKRTEDYITGQFG